jgi:hypothetical protein
MSLTVPPPPPQGLEIVRDAVGGLTNQPDTVFHALRDTNPEELTVAVPHPVYVMGLESIATGAPLSTATLVGWRYLLLGDDRSLAAAEVNTDNAEERVEFSHVNQGPFVESTIAGIAFAEGLDEVRETDFELRLLKIPALYVVSLWLQGNRDILIPLAPSRYDLVPNTPYPEEEFLEILRGPAQDRLRQEGNDLPEL